MERDNMSARASAVCQSISHSTKGSTTVCRPRCSSTRSQGRRGLRVWVLRNQLLLSLAGIVTLLARHATSDTSGMPVLSFIRLSHPKATASTLGRGAHDIQFVAMCVLLFTAVRASCVNHIFRPFAARRGLKPKAAIRFAEQGWQFIYYSTYWTFGMYIWMTSSYWLNFSAIWADWPIYETSASVKIYTLSQMAFWIQQIFVLNMEERRKDYYQMLFHHILTTTLLILAYAYGFFNVTNVVLCLMDVVDMLLPGAKMLKYLGYETACNAVFATFFVSWAIPRHVIYNQLVWSIHKQVPAAMPYGCHLPDPREPGMTYFVPATLNSGVIDGWSHLLHPLRDASGPICMSPQIKWLFVSFLVFLQILSLAWFAMIVGVLVNMFRGKPAEDTRSDEEEDDDDNPRPEDEVVVQATSRSLPASSQISNATAITERTGFSQQGEIVAFGRSPAHISTFRGPKKELLGRIGCEKPVGGL